MFAGPGMYSTLNEWYQEQAESQQGKKNYQPKRAGLIMPIKQREKQGQEYNMGTYLYSIAMMQVQTRKAENEVEGNKR